MPVYVYKNLTTGHTFEVRQSITESAWTEHPESGDPVKRIVQPVGIAFKGSGFYVNDSRASSKGAPTAAASASSDADGVTADKAEAPKNGASGDVGSASTGASSGDSTSASSGDTSSGSKATASKGASTSSKSKTTAAD